MAKLTKKTPTPEQVAALRRFAAAEGRNWKQELRYAWMNGRYPWHCETNDDSGLLQQVRNTLGPSWLITFVA